MMLRHNRIDLALHELRGGVDGGGAPTRPLLILHGLGEATPAHPPTWSLGWEGPIYGLDFTGHGQSTVPRGGGYTAEILIGDVDTALQHLGGPTAIVGRGLGAYIALLVAGARRDVVDGVVLGDGPGMSGGADEPTANPIVADLRPHAPDPYALIELNRDVRPPDYAVEFVDLIVNHTERVEPIQVAARFRPPWLAEVALQRGVADAEGLAAGLTAMR